MIASKNPDNVKKHFIRLRVTEEEHDTFVRKAEEMGYKTVSDFIRTLINDDTDSEEYSATSEALVEK